MAGFSRLVSVVFLAGIFLYFGCGRSGTADVENNAKAESKPMSVIDAKALYQEKCAMCHGNAGYGDGPTASVLPQKPVNFTDKKLMSKISDGELIKKIKQGKPSSGMPAWEGVISEEEIQNLAKYLRDFSK